MIIKDSKHPDLYNHSCSEITQESLFFSRRSVIKGLLAGTAAPLLPALAQPSTNGFSTDEPLTSKYSVTHYNNFYEFSLSKDKPAELAKSFKTDPWTVAIEGEVEQAGNYNLSDLLKMTTPVERIYRLRCVEAWSMVVPWSGFELGELIRQLKPTSKAKYVEFHTLHDPERMPGQQRGALGFFSLDWPYVEGLRMDEALNPLTILATGVYGQSLPPQNGAPLRLIVPWKYGFKSIKSIVKINFRETAPVNSWQKSAPREYGFYANVNPNVDHPRWSQKTERRILDESLFGTKRIDTQMFNGYAEHVAHLYKGMDLSRYF